MQPMYLRDKKKVILIVQPSTRKVTVNNTIIQSIQVSCHVDIGIIFSLHYNF